MELTIERIDDKHFLPIGDFQCKIEDKPMESFLKCEAITCDRMGEGNTFLLVGEDDVIGYYTIKCNAMQFRVDNMNKVYPAIEISRLAVDYRYERQGYGSAILNYILESIYELKKEVGIKYVMLFSVPSAISFYKDKFKFLEFPEDVNILPAWELDGCKGMYAVLE
ncbi:GNAT family N-acetyltransferase (plasmid) [Clostridium botulinum]|uniref:N-acetyltransferase domain-containing protein n=2 Tax=Clostridium botulinum TaxID=1491 RepID=A0A9Q1UXL1_CLOBO|nr:GNAT family N-acetyltransferase [Clostridium botulinum]AEB77354.1 hypothetical protein CbC4_4154 [Clostridium botulinum BKT015925]KEH96342.1 hypothetical protein Y848_13770 [Clostridium botulinum C/D str. Sp77]KGM93338.1 hypothetical protein Z955_15295 [Clostridium botulinum C/D str. DC5]KLU74447.1 hypothetical protein CBC3_p0152 [Clostridium botulinum V891]KOA79528.1 hypothetical protein ADU77_03885 [Clostridium botulinum]